MILRWVWNAIHSQLQQVAVIPEETSDPANLKAGDAWVLRTDSAAAGEPIGLLLALTQSGTPTYEFSYRTESDTTVRTTLS